jgi:hypothetical protein
MNPQQPWPAQEPTQSQPKRRPAWLWPAVIGGVLLVALVAGAALIAGPVANHDGNPLATSETGNLDLLFATAADDESAAPDKGKDRPRLHGRHIGRLGEGEKVVTGSVVSTSDGKLVVKKDNGPEVTIPTNDDTKIAGQKDRTLADLGAGERVIVKVGADGVAKGILAVKAHAAGTITSVDGDRATVVRPGGLSTTLDLSGVSERPAVGAVVVAVGTPADGGATLKVEQIKELPTLG